MKENEVLEFVATHVGSVSALEILLLIQAEPSRMWTILELVRELRSSSPSVSNALRRLKAAGLVSEPSEECYRYEPSSPERKRAAIEIQNLYAAKPLTLIRAIYAAPDEQLRLFSDAFKFKE